MQKHNYSLDILRIIAILCVLYNHQGAYFYTNTWNGLSLQFVFYLFLSLVCKIGPPLFFCISGALLLEKEESFSYILQHRILKFFMIMVLCTILTMFRDKTFLPFYYLATQLNWYVYAYIAFLFMLYFLRKIVKNININEAYLYIVLTFLFYTASGIIYFFGVDLHFFASMQLFTHSNAPVLSWQILFPLSGYCVVKVANADENRKFLIILLIATIVDFLFGFLLLLYSLSNALDINLEFLCQFFIYAPTLLTFYVIYLSKKIQRIREKRILPGVILELSRSTLFVFVIETHTQLSSFIYPIVGKYTHSYISDNMNSFVYMLCEFIVYSIGAIVVRRIYTLCFSRVKRREL